MASTTLFNSNITAKINHNGAELYSLQSNNKEYIWEGNPVFWGKHSPVLFPIVGTLKENTYTYNSISYQLSRHGFARDTTFKLIEKKDDLAVFSIESNEDTKKVYPFEFELQLIYSLENNHLNISYKVINKGMGPMPFSKIAPVLSLESE